MSWFAANSHGYEHKFERDKAKLIVKNLDLIGSVDFYAKLDECYLCKSQHYGQIPFHSERNITVNSTYFTQIELRQHETPICSLSYKFEEEGVYVLNTSQSDNGRAHCELDSIKTGDNVLYPLLWAFLGVLILATVWAVGCVFYRKWRKRQGQDQERLVIQDLGSPGPEHLSVCSGSEQYARPDLISRQRLQSLDIFRGFSILLMIFVNRDGGGYVFFKHSPWNGMTIADLVFPWFLWIMGISMVISVNSQLRKAIPKKTIILRVIRRVVILFVLGLMLNSEKSDSLDNLRIFGVLQRISICYLIAAIIEISFAKIQYEQSYSPLRDLRHSLPQLVAAFLLVIIHLYATFFWNVPGCGRGYLGPGGLHLNGTKSNCTGGAAGYLDRIILGSHMYTTPTCRQVYECFVPFDPEGILGITTATLTVFLGVQAGRIMLMFPTSKARMVRWIFWSVLTGLSGVVLCCASKEVGWIPINKNLWSLSYVSVTSSMAFFALTVCYYISDEMRIWVGQPFSSVGKNPLVLYVGSELTRKLFPFTWQFDGDSVFQEHTHAQLLVVCIWGTALWALIGYVLHVYNVFIVL